MKHILGVLVIIIIIIPVPFIVVVVADIIKRREYICAVCIVTKNQKLSKIFERFRN